jgi:FeS assembly SUF system protein
MTFTDPSPGLLGLEVRGETCTETLVATGGLMVSEEAVMMALRNCYDPEIPVNIVDLGLIYDVRIEDGTVEVDMTLTAPGCPMSTVISEDVKQKLEQVEGVENAVVNMIWEPPWTPERMSDNAKKSLGFN